MLSCRFSSDQRNFAEKSSFIRFSFQSSLQTLGRVEVRRVVVFDHGLRVPADRVPCLPNALVVLGTVWQFVSEPFLRDPPKLVGDRPPQERRGSEPVCRQTVGETS